MQMLQQLGLNKNDIGDTGVEILCNTLHQITSLMSLNVERNNITSRGCKTLAIAITPLPMLQRLFLCGNHIAARGVRELAPAIVSLSESNLNSSSCRETSSGGGSFEISFDEELLSLLPLATARWKPPGKLQEWRIFVQGAILKCCLRFFGKSCGWLHFADTVRDWVGPSQTYLYNPQARIDQHE
jgi:hypothetical protein